VRAPPVARSQDVSRGIVVRALSLLTLLVTACASEPTGAAFTQVASAAVFGPCWAQLQRRFGAENVVADAAAGTIEVGRRELDAQNGGSSGERRETIEVLVRPGEGGAISLEVRVAEFERASGSGGWTERSSSDAAKQLASTLLQDLVLAVVAAHPEAHVLTSRGEEMRAP